MLFKPPVGLEGVSSAICDFTSTSLFPVAVKTSLFTSWALSTVTCRYYLLSLRCHFIWAGVYYLLQLSALVFYLLFSHKYQRVSHLCLLFVFKLVKANCLFFCFRKIVNKDETKTRKSSFERNFWEGTVMLLIYCCYLFLW